MNRDEFEFFAKLVKLRAGYVIDTDMAYMVENRLARLAQRNKCSDPGQLVDLVRGAPEGDVASDVVDALISKDTHFFRGAGVTIYEGYGLTETSPACSANLETSFRIGTVGRPLPGVTIRLAADGEILVRGDHVFQGYWNDPEATAQIIDGDGWLHTGDLGSLDDDGFLRVTGRKKELIVTAAGKNVAPAFLEDRVRTHPLVSHCMLVGDRRPFIAALITIDEESFQPWKRENGKPDDDAVDDLREDGDLRAAVGRAVDDANQAVSHAEAVKAFRILPRDFTEETGELTPSMKIKRAVVAKEYADEIAEIYPS